MSSSLRSGSNLTLSSGPSTESLYRPEARPESAGTAAGAHAVPGPRADDNGADASPSASDQPAQAGGAPRVESSVPCDPCDGKRPQFLKIQSLSPTLCMAHYWHLVYRGHVLSQRPGCPPADESTEP